MAVAKKNNTSKTTSTTTPSKSSNFIQPKLNVVKTTNKQRIVKNKKENTSKKRGDKVPFFKPIISEEKVTSIRETSKKEKEIKGATSKLIVKKGATKEVVIQKSKPNIPQVKVSKSKVEIAIAKGGENEEKQQVETKGKEKNTTKKEVEKTTPRTPKEDPNFQKLEKNLIATGKKQQQHQTSKSAASTAQKSAKSPSNERESMAQSEQVEAMAAAEPAIFDAVDFKAKLMKRIEGMKLPENQEEAADFDKNNDIDKVNEEATKDVEGEKSKAAGPVVETSQQKPNTAAIPQRTPTSLPAASIGKKPITANPSKAMPPKRGDAEVNKPLEDNVAEVDQQMTANKVTDQQLEKSNEPSFQQGLDAKNEAKKDAASAPVQLHQQEKGVLQNARAGAVGKEQAGLAEMHQVRSKLLNKVTGSQKKTGGKDTSERAKIADEINKIYEKSKTDVEKILNDLDTNVKILFTAGTAKAKKVFEDHIAANMRAYKIKRYGDVFGGARWLKDKLMGMPEEVNKFFVTGREKYVSTMDKVIDFVAEYVAIKLNEAKKRVTTGKQEVHNYVTSLPKNLQKLGKEAAEEINDKFDELENSVNSKQDELVDSLAAQYMEGLNEVDARIEEMKAANRGLVDAALGFINGIIETIKKLRDLISSLLAEIQNAMDVIMEDPIGFVTTLFEGVGKGIDLFMANIQKHMLGGFVMWLTGAMGPIGITIPDNLFSLKGIFNLVMQVLGLSWDFVRKKAVLLIGEPTVAVMEKGFEMFQIIRAKGISGLWEYIKEQFTDLKETIIDTIKQMLITQVIEAGIKWLLSLLIPGAGFIKAIMAIKDLIVFFVESAIMLIPSLIKAIQSLASGNVAGVAKAIEKGLAMLLPLVIGLFAKLIGLGGLVKKVQKVIKKVRKRIDRAVTKMIKKAKKKFGKIFSKKKPKKGQAKKIKEDNKKGKPNEITANDRRKHKKIAGKIKRKLEAKPKKESKDFATFYKLKKKEAKQLEDKYQPQLKKGINLDIKTGSLSKEQKDNDVDFKIKIHPNTTKVDAVSETKSGDNQINAQVLHSNEIKDYKGKNKVEVDKNENKERGKKIVGYKVGKGNKKGISIGQSGATNKYVAAIQKLETKESAKKIKEDYQNMLSMSPSDRRKYIGKSANNDHTNFGPGKITIKETKGGVYKLEYELGRANDKKGKESKDKSKFEVTVSYGDAEKAVKDATEVRKVKGENLIVKPEGIGRGTTNPGKKVSNTDGFDNAHIVGDQFGGSGINRSLNINPSSIFYNRTEMANVENKLAANLKDKKGENQAFKYNLEVTAHLKDDKNSTMGNDLKKFLKGTVKKADDKNKGIDLSEKENKDIYGELQKILILDFKNVPAQFVQTNYKTDIKALEAKEEAEKFLAYTDEEKKLLTKKNTELTEEEKIKKEKIQKRNKNRRFNEESKTLEIGEDSDFKKTLDLYLDKEKTTKTKAIPASKSKK